MRPMSELCQIRHIIHMREEQSPEKRDMVLFKTLELLAVIYRHSEIQGGISVNQLARSGKSNLPRNPNSS